MTDRERARALLVPHIYVQAAKRGSHFTRKEEAAVTDAYLRAGGGMDGIYAASAVLDRFTLRTPVWARLQRWWIERTRPQ